MKTFIRFLGLVGLALLLGGSVSAQANARFDVCARGGPLTSNGIGPLKIGLTVDSLKKVCRVISERRLTPEYAITQFRVPVGSDTLSVYEEGGRVYWIEVQSKAFRTVDSVGVGSSLERLLTFEGLDGGVGDGDSEYELTALRSPVCGLVFWVDSKTATAISDIVRRAPAPRDARPTGAVMDTLRSRARTATIKRIDVRGCL
jgi:hypothetical protein